MSDIVLRIIHHQSLHDNIFRRRGEIPKLEPKPRYLSILCPTQHQDAKNQAPLHLSPRRLPLHPINRHIENAIVHKIIVSDAHSVSLRIPALNRRLTNRLPTDLTCLAYSIASSKLSRPCTTTTDAVAGTPSANQHEMMRRGT